MTSKPFVAQFGIHSGNSYMRSTSGKMAVNATSADYTLDLIGTDGIRVPSGNTEQRPSPVVGLIRYNSELGTFEGYTVEGWGELGGTNLGGDVTNSYIQSTFLKLAGGTLTGNITPNSNTLNLGNSIARWIVWGATANFSGAVTSATGFYPVSNTSGTAIGANDKRVHVLANTVSVSGSITPVSNSAGSGLGSSTARFVFFANTIDVSGSIAPVSNTSGTSLGATDKRFNIFANSLNLSSPLNPASNTGGLGNTIARWVLTANTGDFSGTLDVGGTITMKNGLLPESNSVGQTIGGASQRVVVTANSIIVSGSVTPDSNSLGQFLGTTDKRFFLYANSVDVSGSLTPSSNSVGNFLGASNKRFAIYANNIETSTGMNPISNTIGNALGASTARYTLHGNSVVVSAGVFPVSNTVGCYVGADDLRFNVIANTIIASGAIVPFSNSVGYVWGDSNRRVFLYANAISTTGTSYMSTTNFDGKAYCNYSDSGGMMTATAGLGALEVYNISSGASAFMAFHRIGLFATYVGLDQDNQFSVGGWSAGAGMSLAKFGGLGVGTASIGAGAIVATGHIYSAYSDERLKKDVKVIDSALEKVKQLRGVRYSPNERAEEFKVDKQSKRQLGVIAQDVQKILPEAVVTAPFDMDHDGNSKSGENYMTVQYERLVPVLIEAIKELSKEVEDLKNGLLHRRD